MRIAFHAPMKPADHPVPSGDRRMAQLLIAALEAAGHTVEVASRLRTYLPAPDPLAQDRIRAEADREADRLAGAWAETGPPDLWFSYHSYHKAPDLLGPAVARRFDRPYVLAEASQARKRAVAWGSWFEAAGASIRAADVHVCFTERDRAGILPGLKPGAEFVDLPPFLDCSAFPPARDRHPDAEPMLVAVAMMRPGDKVDSFALLAKGLTQMLDSPWRLTIVGDGPARGAVEALFAAIPPARLRWTGALAAQAVLGELDRADIYAWPGLGEAFGISYLEAQAMGLPVAACDTAGVSSVVRDGVTGLLSPDLSPEGFASVLRRLCLGPDRRAAMGCAATAWVRGERTLEGAASVLSQALAAAIASRAAHV